MSYDATCFLRSGYIVQSWPHRGRVTGHTALRARIRLENGESVEVDQFGHRFEVIDTHGRDVRGQPTQPARKEENRLLREFLARKESHQHGTPAPPDPSRWP
jgi:hypothetical protein